MTIETKYNIGEEVWFVDRKIHQRVIDAIRIEQRWRDQDMRWAGKPVIKYWINCEWWLESELFPTKEELIKSL